MSSTTHLTGRRVAIGGLVGSLASLLGYLIVYVTQAGRIDDRMATFNVVVDLLGGDPIPTWRAVGWVFYNAHFVDTEVPMPFGGVRAVNFIAGADDGLLTLLYLVPPVTLLVAGFTAGVLADVDTVVDGGVTGALVVVGYLPVAVIGAIVVRYAIAGGAISPVLVTATLLAGIVYPLVFGSVGGALGGRILAGDSARVY